MSWTDGMKSIFGMIVGIPLGLLSADYAISWHESGSRRDEVKLAMMEAADGTPFSAMAKYFPDELDAMVNELADLPVRRLSSARLHERIEEISARLRRTHANAVIHAPDVLVRDALAMQVEIAAVFADDPYTCTTVALDGPAALPPHLLDRAMPVLAHADIVFHTLRAGAEAAPEGRMPSEQDWSMVMDDFVIWGATERQIELLVKPDRDDPAQCQAFLDFFDFVLEQQTDEAARVRGALLAAALAA